jgi:hypothetical protein|nr:MAG TPA: hypothetical protein [Caudoviricetes sp.]
MTELLENSDNTNADTGVRESPANEATISLVVAQSLADALQKIESYTPTVWVDNESPDIDAAHLNKAEQAIMRVTTAMNSAVDVIKDLQSQVNTTNNNLSQKFAAKDISNGSLDQITTTGFYFGSNITEVTPYIKSHKWCLINAFVSGNSANIFVAAGDAMALSIYRNGDGVYSYYPIATKSDLIQDGIYDATTDSNGVVAINSVVAGVTVDRFAGAYFYNDAVEANVLTRIHLYKKNVYAIAINPDSNKKYANTAMKIHVWYRKS